MWTQCQAKMVPTMYATHQTKFKTDLLVSTSVSGPIRPMKMFMRLIVISQGFVLYFKNRHVKIIPPNVASRIKSPRKNAVNIGDFKGFELL